MARPDGKRSSARLFVALDLPAEVRERLGAWQAAALEDPALRPTRPEGLHVTLCFLGQRPEGDAGRIGEAIRALAPRPVALRFEPEPSALPKGRPGLFAVGAVSPAAVALQAEIAAALERLGVYEPEQRSFWPHVTVARVRSERRAPEPGKRRGKARPRRVAERPSRLPEAMLEPFEAVRIAVYRSTLKPRGAEYERLDGVDLPPA